MVHLHTMLATTHHYLSASKRPALIALAVLPLWLIYVLGVRTHSATARSGMDLATPHVVERWGWDVHTWAHASLIGLIALTCAWWIHRQGSLKRAAWTGAGVIGESAAYAAALGATIILIIDEAQLVAIGLSTTLIGDASVGEALVLSAGAGLYEEFFFRLLLIVPLVFVGQRLLAMPRPIALGAAILIGSLLFSGAHHVVFGAEPFDSYVFAYRTVAGVLFGSLLLLRGFAVCVWTHAAYDFIAVMS